MEKKHPTFMEWTSLGQLKLLNSRGRRAFMQHISFCLVLPFHKFREFQKRQINKRMVRIGAAEAEISSLLVPSVDQAPKTPQCKYFHMLSSALNDELTDISVLIGRSSPLNSTKPPQPALHLSTSASSVPLH